MRRPRFSIAGLMGLVVVVAVGVAALRSASEDWAGIVLMLTLGLLGVALLGVIFRDGPRRAFWSGFALFGGGYLTLTMAPWFSAEVGPRLATTRGLDLLFARLHPAPRGLATPFGVFYSVNGNQYHLPPQTWQLGISAPQDAALGGTFVGDTAFPLNTTGPADPNAPTASGAWTAVYDPTWATSQPAGLAVFAGPADPEPFRRIGQYLVALLAAWIGGRIARHFAADRVVVAA